MGPKTSDLRDRLRQTSALLNRADESHWAAWMDKSLHRIENSDLSGIDHLLGAYGGIGSFNDLVLIAANGHSVSDADYRSVNDRLDSLRSEMYELACAIRRNAEITD